MPNTIPAAGEAMPQTSRRTFLGGVAAAAIPLTAGSVAAIQTVTPSDPAADPLLEAIKAYRSGLIDFSRRVANEDDDKKWSEHGAATYEPWQSVLDQWDEPARTREGAIEALRAALSEEDGVYGTDAAHCMVKAALGYLEGVRA